MSSLRVRRNILQTEKPAAELADDEHFQALQACIADLEDEIEACVTVFSPHSDGPTATNYARPYQSVGTGVDATATAD